MYIAYLNLANCPHARSFLIALFFPILIVQLGMSGLRQALATGFLMLALVEFVSGNRLKTALYILVGALFHQSVIIMLPLALVAGRQITLSRLLIALVVLGPLAFVILGERAEVYNNRYVAQVYGENSSSGALLRYGLAALPFLFLVKYRNKVKSAHPQIFNLMWVFSFICFAMLPLAFLSTVALHRMVYYILPVSSLALISVASVVLRKEIGKWLHIFQYFFMEVTSLFGSLFLAMRIFATRHTIPICLDIFCETVMLHIALRLKR